MEIFTVVGELLSFASAKLRAEKMATRRSRRTPATAKSARCNFSDDPVLMNAVCIAALIPHRCWLGDSRIRLEIL